MNIAFKTENEYPSLFASKERGVPDNVNVILMDLRRPETTKIPFNTVDVPEKRVLQKNINISLLSMQRIIYINILKVFM